MVMPDFDSSAFLSKSGARNLASLMTTGEDGAKLWRPDELAAIFHHQMSAPMQVDLGALDFRATAKLRRLSDAKGLLLKSFDDLFSHPAPLIELLAAVKDFAKANMDSSEDGLPSEVAAALYYTSIAAALVRLDARITQLADADLERGLRWAIAQPWVDGKTNELLTCALEKISSRQEGVPK